MLLISFLLLVLDRDECVVPEEGANDTTIALSTALLPLQHTDAIAPLR